MDKSELMTKTVRELRTIAEKFGVRRAGSLRKEELAEAILKASGEDAAVAGDVKGADSSESAKKTAVEADDAADGAAAADDATDAPGEDADDESEEEEPGVDDDVDDESEEDADDESEEDAAEEDDGDAEEDDAETVEEPAPVEPDSIFIDHGALLPEYLPGTCLFALVRDPGTIFVYWNAEFESPNGWLLTAYDRQGNIMQQFSTPARRNGRGYFRIPSSLAGRITLSAIGDNGRVEEKLASRIRIAEQLGLAQPHPHEERWVDFQSRRVVSSAPAPGYAPQPPETAQRMIAPAITGGGYDRSVDAQAGPFGWAQNAGSTSSRFGTLGAPGSSERLVTGSSDRIVRNRH